MRLTLRDLAPSATAVAFFTVLIATTTELPFWVPLCALTFNWIIAGLIGRWFESRNPTLTDKERSPAQFEWGIFAVWLIVFVLVGWGVSWKADLPYFTAFAYVLLGGTTVLSLNGIVIDWEDNQKGGWLNP